jgi:hypothetical protein
VAIGKLLRARLNDAPPFHGLLSHVNEAIAHAAAHAAAFEATIICP